MTASSPAGIRSLDVATRRLRTHVLSSGPDSGTPVVFVHGNVSSARFFARILADLPSRWRGLAVDLRGFGESQTLPVDATRGLRDFSDDLHALLEAPAAGLTGSPVHLVGWSMGGGVALQYAMDHPGWVASIALLAPMSPFGFGGTLDASGRPCWPDFAGSGGGTAGPELVQRIKQGDRSESSTFSPRSVLNALYLKPPRRMPADEEESLVTAMLSTTVSDGNYPGTQQPSQHWPFAAPGSLGVNNAISPKYCNLEGFAAIDPQPDVLWIRGAEDKIVADCSLADPGYLGHLGVIEGWPGADIFPPQPMIAQLRAVLDQYARAGGRFEEVVIADCGHSPHLEYPLEVAGLLTQFLGRQ